MADSELGSGRTHVLDLRRLQQFVAVVELGSLTDAAVALGLTQQALSAAMRGLETQLGVTLFFRSRGMQPSAAGLRLYECSHSLLASATKAVSDVQMAAQEAGGVLTVGYTPALTSVQVYEALTEHLPDGLSLKMDCLSPESLRRRMAAGELDFALGRAPRLLDGLASEQICFHRFSVAVRSEDAHELDPEGVALGDLAGRRLVYCSGGSIDSSDAVAMCRAAGFEPTVKVVNCGGLTPVAAPYAAGGGFALVTDYPGLHFGGRVTVLNLLETVVSPVYAFWLPASENGVVGSVIQAVRGTKTLVSR
ncbi:MAG: LysR family transcriptional regulator [Rhodococcus sp.]|nr:LysR family transcriptional regulator [Rhodococcus sp. (in: high G+C Gram-positive bacteria)]